MHQSIRRIILPALVSGALQFSGLALAASSEGDTLANVQQQCDSCHGINPTVGSGAPVLDGMQRRYLEEQMGNFRAGARGNGNDSDNEFVRQMTQQLQTLSSDQLEDLARLYSRRDLAISDQTVAGDATRGGALFEEHCAGCHTSAMGRRFTGSPPITHLAGPYILSQLQAFASGQRGFEEAGEHKLKMVEVASRFSPQELLDITAHIKAGSH